MAKVKKSVKKPVKKAAVAKKVAPKKTSAKKAVPVKKAAPKKKAPFKSPAKASNPKAAPKKSLSEIVAPLDDRIVVSVAETGGERRTASGLILVGESDQGENVRGTVRAVGRGHLTKKGRIRPLALKVGDEILFPKFSGSKVQIAGEEMFILRESEVLGVLN